MNARNNYAVKVIAFSALTVLVGRQEEPVKQVSVVADEPARRAA